MDRPLLRIWLVVPLVVGGIAFAIPPLVNYQGYLTDDTGVPVADGNYTITFSLYDLPSGGSPVWTETHMDVPVAGGLFNATLGVDDTLGLPFDVGYWLALEIGGEELSRVRLTSVPYSYRAQWADRSIQAARADTAEYALWADTADFVLAAPRDDDWTPDTAGFSIYRLAGNVGIGTPSPQERLEVVGNLSLNTSHGVAYVGEVKSSRADGGLYVRPDTGAGLYLGPANELIINNGNVGIGHTNPNYPLVAQTSTAMTCLYVRNTRNPFGTAVGAYAMGSGTNYALTGYADGGAANYGLFVSSGMAYVEGEVGIGTTNPQARLHVSDSTSVVSAKIENTSENGNAFLVAENDSVDWHVGVWGAHADKFFIALPEDPKLTITTDGAVGIGTIDPDDDLHVVGDIYCTGKLTSDGGNDPPYVLYNRETREAIRARVEREVPKEKQDGAVLFWNGQTCRFEVYLPDEGEFRDLAGNLLEN